MKERHKLIQSYVKDKFFISTAYRRCSAVSAFELWYYETIVWEWNSKTRDVGKMLETEDSGESEFGALDNHYEICTKYFEKSGDK